MQSHHTHLSYRMEMKIRRPFSDSETPTRTSRIGYLYRTTTTNKATVDSNLGTEDTTARCLTDPEERAVATISQCAGRFEINFTSGVY